MNPSYLDTAQGRKLAYHKTEGTGPGVVFLGGYVSDMEGTKALYLENWAKAEGRAFLRFDYSGHGQSSIAVDVQAHPSPDRRNGRDRGGS